jgi:hypothetical protein
MRKLGLGWIVVSSIATALASCSAMAAGPTAPPEGFFPIGVAGLDPNQFATWKRLGANTVVGNITPGAWQDFWNDTAVRDGLWQIRNPRFNPAQDNGQPYLLAWAYPDLPDVNKVPAASLAKTYSQLKALNSDRPIVIDLSAANPGSADATYTATADWISSQVFPISALNQPNWIDKTKATSTAENPGKGLAALSTLSNGKPQLAYIETSDRDGSGPIRAPTADEVRGETWDAILHGASGIIYSPQGKSTSDATPASVAASVKLTDALITKYSSVLTSLGDGVSNDVDLGGGLEGTSRTVDGTAYYFVLNDSHTTITNARFALLGLTGESIVDVPEERRTVEQTRGVTMDSFAPYQLHIYSTESIGRGVGAGVPEPTGLGGIAVGMGLLMRRSPRKSRARSVLAQ